MLTQGPGLLPSRAGAGKYPRLSDEARPPPAPEISAPPAQPGCQLPRLATRAHALRWSRRDRASVSSHWRPPPGRPEAHLGRTRTIGVTSPVILGAHLPSCRDQTHWAASPADSERGRKSPGTLRDRKLRGGQAAGLGAPTPFVGRIPLQGKALPTQASPLPSLLTQTHLPLCPNTLGDLRATTKPNSTNLVTQQFLGWEGLIHRKSSHKKVHKRKTT